MPVREIKLKSDKEQIFEHFSEGAQPPVAFFQGWLEPPSLYVVGAYAKKPSHRHIVLCQPSTFLL